MNVGQFTTIENETWGKNDVVLHKDVGNTLDGVCQQWGSLRNMGAWRGD